MSIYKKENVTTQVLNKSQSVHNIVQIPYHDALFIRLCYNYTKFSQIQTYFKDYLPFLDGNQHIQ